MSPERRFTCRCSPRDIRDSADSGSPCEPVEISSTWSGGRSSTLSSDRTSPSGTVSSPRSCAICMLRTIERPTKAILRLFRYAESIICCTRCTCEANDATITRWVALEMNDVQHRPDLPLGRDEPGHLGVGRVHQEQVDTLVAELGEPAEVGEPAVQRQLIELDVAGVQHGAGRCADADRQRVRDRVVDREELQVERARPCGGRPRRPPRASGVIRCSRHFAAISASENRAPITGRSLRSRSSQGSAPMWSSCPWVITTASMSSTRSSTSRRSGRIRSTPGWPSSGNSTPQSTTSSRPSYS